MTILIIDTSTDLCLIALAKEDRIVAEEIFPHQNNLSKNLLPSIQSLMQRCALELSGLTAIAAGIGPGSYTGTRLGAAVAKSLAFALQIPMKPFSSPLAFIPQSSGSFAFLLPTRAGPFFLLKGTRETGPLRQEISELIPSDTVAAHTENVDFLVCPTPQSLPLSMKEKPCLAPVPNLSLLCQYLLTTQPSSPENIELQYLHTPF
ncbi:MAG: tRNA (adenosine(37)-N6)-threonylcarbamoyltransferase complex dimerization subunit type 1 TsaB [Verrucomicrobia bacterium]|nr:tRNA (adenosine(37)-N6)-threonylcarbamoyltransferase complex dimerization subunit type 1 TsaB [Verrucomicrobiota bacterium]